MRVPCPGVIFSLCVVFIGFMPPTGPGATDAFCVPWQDHANEKREKALSLMFLQTVKKLFSAPLSRTLPAALLPLLLISPVHSESLRPGSAPHVSEAIAEQRHFYVQAHEALERGRREQFQTLRESLLDYPLLRYLDYADLNKRLGQVSAQEIESFLENYPGSYLGRNLQRDWVTALAQQERWDEVIAHHDPRNTTTVLNCKTLMARYQRGDQSALDEVPRLWNVAVSQPNECDPIFEAWMAEDRLTPEIAWQRLGRNIQAGNRNLARYISRLMPGRERPLAELYLLVDNQPERLKDHPGLSQREPEVLEILNHGLRRLANIDAPQAMLQMHQYHRIHDFPEQDLIALQRFIAMRLLLQGFVTETETLIRNTPELATETLVSFILRDALREQDWRRVEAWLEQLPGDAKDSERWQYWRARMLGERGSPEDLARADDLYRELAGNRSFYGFMAADRLGVSYELVDKPVEVTDTELLALYEIPAIVRAYELYQLGDERNARNEWQQAVREMTTEQIAGSGKLADSWGWHRNSIQAMIQIGHWDDLQLRFPLAYTELFHNAASEYAIQPHLLLAVARQESAFMHDVRSPAGARGLMQLMPGTARQTASGMGMNVSTQDLYQPEVNIALGSRYMAQLLEEFGGNRALAAAAYNAGPNRVRQWLRRSAGTPLPMDMWIETIPFAETRGYVQNVLAYTVIYGYRMGEMIALLSDEELRSTL